MTHCVSQRKSFPQSCAVVQHWSLIFWPSCILLFADLLCDWRGFKAAFPSSGSQGMLGLQQLLGMPLPRGGTFLCPPQLPSRLQCLCAGSIPEAESHLDRLNLSWVWRVLVCTSMQISSAVGVVRLALILGHSSPEEHLLFSGFLSRLPLPCACWPLNSLLLWPGLTAGCISAACEAQGILVATVCRDVKGEWGVNSSTACSCSDYLVLLDHIKAIQQG